MAATTTAQLSSIWRHARRDHAAIAFRRAPAARWSPDERTVFYRAVNSVESLADALHELGHALNNHTDFHQDIDLLRLEREAWETAAGLAISYGWPLPPELAENALDTYREWLHARSRCPTCRNPGIQSKTTNEYYCVICASRWRTNDARNCELRRFTTTPKNRS